MRGLEIGFGPRHRHRNAVANIKIRIAVIERGISWIEVAKVKRAVTLGECGTEIIERVGQSVIRQNKQARMAKLLRLEMHVQGVVVGKAVRTALINSTERLVWPRQAGLGNGAGGIIRVGSH